MTATWGDRRPDFTGWDDLDPEYQAWLDEVRLRRGLRNGFLIVAVFWLVVALVVL